MNITWNSKLQMSENKHFIKYLKNFVAERVFFLSSYASLNLQRYTSQKRAVCISWNQNLLNCNFILNAYVFIYLIFSIEKWWERLASCLFIFINSHNVNSSGFLWSLLISLYTVYNYLRLAVIKSVVFIL